MEIERKFLLNILPDDENHYKHAEIEQAYISTDPTIRLRRCNGIFYLTVKQNGLLAREEIEFAITREQYEHLWNKIETNVIRKTRFFIPLHDDLIAEADVYHGDLQGLMTVEVEFGSIAEAERFIPPSWFGADVTHIPEYANSSLAIKGMCLINKIKT